MDDINATWELVKSRLIDEFNEGSQTTDAEARLAFSSDSSSTPSTQHGRCVHFEPNPRVNNNSDRNNNNRGQNRRRNDNQHGKRDGKTKKITST